MAKRTVAILAVVALVGLPALSSYCKYYWQEVERETGMRIGEMEPLLPQGIELSTEYFENRDDRRDYLKKKNVRNTLIRLGAHCKDGKICDYWEKEIRFHMVYEGGGPPPRRGEEDKHWEWLKEDAQKIRELRQKFTAIVMWSVHAPK